MLKRTLVMIAHVGVLGLIPLLNAADAIPPAPIPPQILSAKKVFISNAGDDCFRWPNVEPGCTTDAFYNEFYAAIKKWGHFDISPSPADADLVFELTYGSSWVANGTGTPFLVSSYKLAILDSRTHFTLWSIIVHPDPAILTYNRTKNDALARAQVLTNLKILFAPADALLK